MDSTSVAAPAKVRGRKGRRSCKKGNSRTSLAIFRKHMIYSPEGIDPSGIFTNKCYEDWLSSRATNPKRPEESFRRALTAQLRGSDGRQPFTVEEETAILKCIRSKNIFAGMFNNSEGTGAGIGNIGFRGRGFHEMVKFTRESAASAFAKAKINAPKSHSVSDQPHLVKPKFFSKSKSPFKKPKRERGKSQESTNKACFLEETISESSFDSFDSSSRETEVGFDFSPGIASAEAIDPLMNRNRFSSPSISVYTDPGKRKFSSADPQDKVYGQTVYADLVFETNNYGVRHIQLTSEKLAEKQIKRVDDPEYSSLVDLLPSEFETSQYFAHAEFGMANDTKAETMQSLQADAASVNTLTPVHPLPWLNQASDDSTTARNMGQNPYGLFDSNSSEHFRHCVNEIVFPVESPPDKCVGDKIALIPPINSRTNLSANSSDPRMNLEFVLPNISQFYPFLTVAKELLSKNLQHKEIGFGSKELMRGDVIQHRQKKYQLQVSKVHARLMASVVFPIFNKLKVGEACWFRQLIYRCDGTPAWMHTRIKKLPSGDLMAEYQDISQLEIVKRFDNLPPLDLMELNPF